MVIKEVQLTDNEVSRIQDYNAEVVTLRNLIKEMNEDTSEFIFNKVMNNLKTAQVNYDGWFLELQEKHNIETRPEYHWNVSFSNKVLQLIKD